VVWALLEINIWTVLVPVVVEHMEFGGMSFKPFYLGGRMTRRHVMDFWFGVEILCSDMYVSLF